MVTDADIQTTLIVGFEIHVQLATRTKMFCPCELTFGADPNTRNCPTCLGLPGSLPVMNRRAVEMSVLTGMALECDISTYTKWDRKSYYYPDLPKNYQISQYDLPLSHDGRFRFNVDGEERSVGIIRAHLEEDAGKNLHDVPGCSLVDLNRAGTPLLEIVTEPDIHDAGDAFAFCTELQKLVTYLGVSHGNMQMGQMRFEPNINVSIHHDGREYRTPISEVKNLNSFRSVRSAIEYEYRRQVQDWLADPGYLFKERPNENRGWDDDRGTTVFQRGKEAAHDYRYFPDPDLVPVTFTPDFLDGVRASMPELPQDRRQRLVDAYRLSDQDAAAIVVDRATADLFDGAIADGGSAETLGKHFLNVWAKLANDREVSVGKLGLTAERVAGLAKLVDEGTVSATAANKLAAKMLETDDDPKALAEQLGLIVVQDKGQTEAWVDQAFADNEQAVKDAVGNPKKAAKAAGFLRGQVMRISGGKADPKLVGELIQTRLDEMAK